MSVIAFIAESLILALFKESIKYDELVLILIFINSIVLLLLLGKSERLKGAKVPLISAYILRLIFLFLDIYGRDIYKLPMSGGDTESFFKAAVFFADGGHPVYGGAFPKIMGTFMKFCGHSRLWATYVLVMCSIAALVLFFMIMTDINVPLKKRSAIIMLIGILPNYAMMSSIFLRESVITLLLTVSLRFFVKWFLDDKKNMSFSLLLAIVFALLSSLFHGACGTIVLGYIIVVFLYNKQKKAFSITVQNSLLSFLLLFVFVFVFIRYGDALFTKLTRAESLSDIASGVGRGDSSYARYVGDSSTPLRMLIYTVPRIVYFMFSPFPWQWRGLSDIFAFIFSSLFYMIIVGRVFLFLKSKRPQNRVLLIALCLIAICIVFVFSWGLANTGTAIRHRDKFIFLFGLILSLTYAPSEDHYG
jgi:hypothetical protein